VTRGGGDPDFAFLTAAWRACVATAIELTKVHRQRDQAFVDVLQQVR